MVRRAAVVGVMLVCGAVRAGAQQAATTPALPEYTDQQRWGRLGFVDAAWMAAVGEVGRAQGLDTEQIAQRVAAYFTQGWLGGADARWLLVAMRQNHLAYPNGRVEVSTLSDSLVVARFNTPVLGSYGPDRSLNGAPLEDWKALNLRVHQLVGEYVGVSVSARWEGDWMVMTMRSRFEAPRQSTQLRAERGGFVSRAITVDLIRVSKARGQTAHAAGLETAKVWASGWSANDTPWRLFRTMTWNMMVDPDYHCDIVSGSAESVRARCNRPWVTSVRGWQTMSGVTPEEYDAYQLGLEQGVATALGMTWEVQIEGNDRLISVRRK